MTTNPEEIRLTDDYRKRLARVADEQGTTWQTLLDRFVTQIEQTKSNGEPPPSAPLPPGVDEDTEYLALCMEELRQMEAEPGGAKKPTIEDAWRILSAVPGSLVDDINEDRDDR